MRLIVACIILLTAFVPNGIAHGHELWLSPKQYVVKEGAAIVANIRVGENFSGSVFAYIPKNFTRFDVISETRTTPVEGRIGDVPALSVAPLESGLVTLVYQSTASTVTYYEWEKFEQFVRHKDLVGVIDQHRARGLPERRFAERYFRYAKSLLAVGHGEGNDKPLGLETEIVAEANPYTDDMAEGLRIRVLYQGQPRTDALVEVYERDTDGAVTLRPLRTDVDGRATVPVAVGHEYLLDAVVMRPVLGDNAENAVWESLWASLTFRVPEPP